MSRFTRPNSASKVENTKEVVEVGDAVEDELSKDSLKDLNIPVASIQSDMKYDRKFFIGRENLLASGGAVYSLKHPRTSTKAYYYIDLNAADVQELILMENKTRSFFFGDSIISEGSFTVLATIHPMFLVLGYLIEKAQKRYVTLDDSLKIAAEFKEIEDEVYYRYSEDCLMKWLEKRFSILMGSIAKNGNLNKNILSDEDVLKRYTFGVLCDYLPQSTSLILKERLKIKDPEIFMQPPRAFKRSAVEEEQENEPAKKVQKVSRAVKQLKSASKGLKDLLVSSPNLRNNQNSSWFIYFCLVDICSQPKLLPEMLVVEDDTSELTLFLPLL
uniref:Ribonuclease H2 subunit B n=1 Tax=Ditylenchus dipsaci TaxID=166011 RepID=A0A915D8L9_9BILA